jgi:hypothetical protein
MAVNSPALFFRGFPAYGATNAVKTITTAALTSNLVTITLSANHGYSTVGQLVTVQGVGASYDGTYPVYTYPALNTFTYVKTAGNIGSASVTPNATAVFNTASSGGNISNNAITNYVAIVTTAAAHGLAVGDIVCVNTGTTGTEVTAAVVTSIPSTTTFTYNTSTQTVSNAAISQGAWAKYPAVYTLGASTVGIVTNIVLTNPQTAVQGSSGVAQFNVSIAGTPVITNYTLQSGQTAVIDMKSYIGTTGDKIYVAANTPTATATISGMTVV